MPTDPEDVFELLKLIRMDATQLQARITDLGRMVAALDLPRPRKYPCTECTGGLEFSTQAQLREHLVNVHDWQAQLDLGTEAARGDDDPEARHAIAENIRQRFGLTTTVVNDWVADEPEECE